MEQPTTVLVGFDVEHEGKGAEAFSIGFVVIEKSATEDPVVMYRATLTNRDICKIHMQKTVKDDDDFWSWPENKTTLHRLFLEATCDNTDFAKKVREVVEKIHTNFPDAFWVSDTGGSDFYSTSLLLNSAGFDPIHFNADHQYRGFKFYTDNSIPHVPEEEGAHDPGMDALWIAKKFNTDLLPKKRRS